MHIHDCGANRLWARAALPGRKSSSAWDSKLRAGPSGLKPAGFRPWSPVREEVLGVGGLCTLAKGVYKNIQAGETNKSNRKTFTHK